MYCFCGILGAPAGLIQWQFQLPTRQKKLFGDRTDPEGLETSQVARGTVQRLRGRFLEASPPTQHFVQDGKNFQPLPDGSGSSRLENHRRMPAGLPTRGRRCWIVAGSWGRLPRASGFRRPEVELPGPPATTQARKGGRNCSLKSGPEALRVGWVA